MPDYRDRIINNLMFNTLEITFPDNDLPAITENNIASESMSLKQSICDETKLVFGGCTASEFKIDLINTTDRAFTSSQLTGRWISVRITQTYATATAVYPSATLYPARTLFPGTTVESETFYIFSGFIDSAKVNKNDKNVITVIAYDAFALLYDTDATNAFFEFLKRTNGYNRLIDLFTMCLRDNGKVNIAVGSENSAFFNERWGSYAVADAFTIINRDWLESQDKIDFGTLLKYACEIMGLFGTVKPNSGKGEFKLVSLSGTAEIYDFYEYLYAEEYDCRGYDDICFTITGTDVQGKHALVGTLAASEQPENSEDKIYDFTDNILLWLNYDYAGTTGRTFTVIENFINNTPIGSRLALATVDSEETTEQNTVYIYNRYKPLTATLDGRLWVEIGSPIEISVRKTTVDGDYILDENDQPVKERIKTYMLSRTLTGIQALTDSIEVKGTM